MRQDVFRVLYRCSQELKIKILGTLKVKQTIHLNAYCVPGRCSVVYFQPDNAISFKVGS